MGTKRNPEWLEGPKEEEGKREGWEEKSATVRYLESIPRVTGSHCRFIAGKLLGLTLLWEGGSKHLLLLGLYCIF